MINVGFALFLTAYGYITPIGNIHTTQEECEAMQKRIAEVRPQFKYNCLEVFIKG